MPEGMEYDPAGDVKGAKLDARAIENQRQGYIDASDDLIDARAEQKAVKEDSESLPADERNAQAAVAAAQAEVDHFGMGVDQARAAWDERVSNAREAVDANLPELTEQAKAEAEAEGVKIELNDHPEAPKGQL